MSITRRQFLLGTAAGLILPSFYDKAHSFFENHGEPLLIAPKRPGEILYACSDRTEQGYQLLLGHPESVWPDKMSVREFCLTFGEGDPETWWREEWICTDEPVPVDLDADMDQFAVEEWWLALKSPLSQAYHYLQCLDLGPQLQGSRAVGGLDFGIGGSPGMGFVYVDAVDEVSLSLLQHRLNVLETGIEVRTY